MLVKLEGKEIRNANNLYGVHPTDPEWETALKTAQAVATQGSRLWISIPEPSKALAKNLAQDGLKVNKVVPNAQALQELANICIMHYSGQTSHALSQPWYYIGEPLKPILMPSGYTNVMEQLGR